MDDGSYTCRAGRIAREVGNQTTFSNQLWTLHIRKRQCLSLDGFRMCIEDLILTNMGGLYHIARLTLLRSYNGRSRGEGKQDLFNTSVHVMISKWWAIRCYNGPAFARKVRYTSIRKTLLFAYRGTVRHFVGESPHSQED